MKVKVYLSQADAIRLGLLSHGERTVEITSWDGWTDEERELLARIVDTEARYNIVVPLQQHYDGISDVRVPREAGALVLPAEPSPETLLARIRELLALQAVKASERAARENAKREEAVAKRAEAEARFARDGAEAFLNERSGWTVPWVADVGALSPETVTLVHAERDRRNECLRLEAERVNAERCVATAAREARRDVLLELLDVYLSPDQRERSAEGVLPKAERNEAHRDGLLRQLFAGQEPARYERLTSGDIDHDDYCDASSRTVRYDATQLETYTAEQWAAVKSARAVVEAHLAELPGEGWSISVDVTRHDGWCDCEGSSKVSRCDLTVTLSHPDLADTTRRYAIDAE